MNQKIKFEALYFDTMKEAIEPLNAKFEKGWVLEKLVAETYSGTTTYPNAKGNWIGGCMVILSKCNYEAL